MIAVLTDKMIHHRVVGVLCQILKNNKKYKIDTYISAMNGIGEHRNVIVKAFLETNCDYLVMIDSDNPPPKNLLDLVELDKDVIGLPTPINMSSQIPDIRWNIFDENGITVKFQGQGLEEVNMIGSGVMIIKRKVLEEVKYPFTTVRNEEDIRIVGTDAAFCKKCKEQGFKIWTHWDYCCGHYKDTNLLFLV